MSLRHLTAFTIPHPAMAANMIISMTVTVEFIFIRCRYGARHRVALNDCTGKRQPDVMFVIG